MPEFPGIHAVICRKKLTPKLTLELTRWPRQKVAIKRSYLIRNGHGLGTKFAVSETVATWQLSRRTVIACLIHGL